LLDYFARLFALLVDFCVVVFLTAHSTLLLFPTHAGLFSLFQQVVDKAAVGPCEDKVAESLKMKKAKKPQAKRSWTSQEAAAVRRHLNSEDLGIGRD
jgi:hypothetical protein